MNAEEEADRIRAIYPGAAPLVQGSQTFVFLPKLVIATRTGDIVRDALLCPYEHSGYTTRLFLEAAVPGHLANWTEHTLFTRKWYTWSWNNIVANQAWTSILANHLAAFR